MQVQGWYADGRLGKKDFKQAHQWFEKAAALGAAEGWRNLGLLNENGDGVARDYVKAFAYYQRAVDAGSSIAASALGHFYENGLGIPVAPALAEFWYKKSIAEGFMGAKDALGRMYMRQEKYDQAVVLIRERADISVAALMLLYPMYARGLGVARNDVVGLSVSLLVMELTKGKVGEANMIRAVLPADQQAIAKRLFELYMEQRRVIPIIDAYLATGKVPD
jgi:TPR repeat protein